MEEEPLEEQPEEEEEEGEEGGGGRQGPREAARGAGRAAVVSVLPDAGGVGHDVGDVVLLVDAVQEVSHGALGEDGHVFPAVRLHPQGDGRLGLVAGLRWVGVG